MDLIDAVRQYVDRILTDPKLSGMKVLLLDEETTKIVSLVYSQSQVLEKEVFLVEPLTVDHERMTHLKCAVFVRPTAVNIEALRGELKDPKFGEYHIFFSNILPQDLLMRLAEYDELEVVRQVQEFYGDYYPVNPDFYHLGEKNSVILSCPKEGNVMSPIEANLFNRSVEGVLSFLLSLKRKPVVRYAGGSEVARQVANEITANMQRDGLFDFRRQDTSPVLVILDRRDDPITPLLSQWTYQAMVHELLGLDNNRVDLSRCPGVRKDMREVVLSPSQDTFFRDHRYSNFGDLGMAIKSLVDEYQAKTKSNENIQSIEDMQRFMENYPQFRQKSHEVSKHVTIMTELARLVDVQSLMDLSQFEQEMVCSDDHSAHFRELMDKLQNPQIHAESKLRLALLYAVRYEGSNSHQITQVRKTLVKQGLPDARVRLIDLILQYGGAKVRGSELFSKGMFKNLIKGVTQGIQGVSNVYSQHVPPLMKVADQILKGMVKENQYPSTVGGNPKDRPRELFVFVVGGVTLEEACKVAELNQSLGNKQKVLLGGTEILNSSSFLRNLQQSFDMRMGASSTTTWAYDGKAADLV